MTIRVYVSGISGSHDVRKTQQRVLFILSMLPVELEIIDVTEPGREKDKAFMQEEVRKHDKKEILPPQIFNGDQYCGNYDDFQLAADDDVLMSFLKLEEPSSEKIAISNGSSEIKEPDSTIIQNGVAGDEGIIAESKSAEEMPSEHEEKEVTGEDKTSESNVDDSNVTEKSEPVAEEKSQVVEEKVQSEEGVKEKEESEESEEESD